VAARTLLNVDHAFFTVCGNDFGLLMLMATVAGVALIKTVQVACSASSIVIFIKREEAVVIKRCRLPSRRLVTG